MADQNMINQVRELQARGLIDQLSPEEKQRALGILNQGFEAESQAVLRPKKEISQDPTPEPSSYVDQLLAPIKTSIQNPVAAVANVTNAVTSASNPLPLVNLINKANPIDVGEIDASTEAFQTMFNFPIVRGAELASRLFVDEEDRAPLTSFAELVNQQKASNEAFSEKTPGVAEGVETGLILGSGAQAIGAIPRLVKGAAKNLPKAKEFIRQGIVNFKKGQSTKHAKKAAQLTEDLLSEGDGPIMDALVNRPEKVKEILDRGTISLKKGKFKASEQDDVFDIAMQVRNEVDSIKTNLGKTIGEFKQKAFQDTKTRFPINSDVTEILQTIKKRTTFEGKSTLPGELRSSIERSIKAAERGVTTPSQSLGWVETLDDVIDYGRSTTATTVGKNSVKSVTPMLKQVRRILKDDLRNNSADGRVWAEADSNFSKFLEVSERLKNNLKSNSTESFISNIFNKNKTEVRNSLRETLDMAEAVNPLAKGHGNAFFSRLADVRAAEKMKTGIRANRVMQEQAHEIVRKWSNIGKGVGFSVGATVGGLSGSGYVGAGAAGLGMTGGRMAGRFVGQKISNPDRILKSALKAKSLSKDAKALAKDMSFMVNSFGPEASVAFLDLVGPVPAVNELIKFSSGVNKKGVENEKR